ncbi:hypothetical protein HU200_027922 [Digitaria exilis]|uniref:F-box domain-containing protein n=1 Tax=Digitaria exilis TaxID=1010633 RepID=A0A835EVZ6_9POAL|nr:hypothetical protein HU200_027922 [Digitaria exilis]
MKYTMVSGARSATSLRLRAARGRTHRIPTQSARSDQTLAPPPPPPPPGDSNQPSSMAPPPQLLDELVEEVLIRFPPDDPASLLRAALVCKRWSRLVSARRFRARFRSFHRELPMLGAVVNTGAFVKNDGFVSTSSFRCQVPADLRDGSMVLDARHGRVLFHSVRRGSQPWIPTLTLWDPITGERRELPRLPDPYGGSSNFAVLCAAAGCNHLDCSHGGPFLVVAVVVDNSMTFARVYSSQDREWGDPTFAAHINESLGRTDHLDLVPGALAGNAVYFQFHTTDAVVKFDLATREMVLIRLPAIASKRPISLVTIEDGDLGFAVTKDSMLYLWSRVAGTGEEARWEQSRVIELKEILPATSLRHPPIMIGIAWDPPDHPAPTGSLVPPSRGLLPSTGINGDRSLARDPSSSSRTSFHLPQTDRPGKASTMAAPQWQELYEVLLEEVLVRLPPDDPASLLHAALVCKRWARVVSGRGFRARFRGFHCGSGGGGGAPMLGFLCDLRGDRDDGAVSRFVPTSSFRPRPTELRGWRAADARHGRVLIYPLRKRFAAGSRTPDLTVCVPATGELRRLPAASPRPRPSSWSAALLDGHHHHRPGCHDDGDGPFRVVLVGTTTDMDGIFSSVYSSVDDAWSEASASTAAHPDSSPTCLESVPGVHVGNALHFLFQGSASILRYDLDSREVSLIQRPPACTYYQGRPLLMTMEDGKLGFAAVNHSTLSLWPREMGAEQSHWA